MLSRRGRSWSYPWAVGSYVLSTGAIAALSFVPHRILSLVVTGLAIVLYTRSARLAHLQAHPFSKDLSSALAKGLLYPLAALLPVWCLLFLDGFAFLHKETLLVSCGLALAGITIGETVIARRLARVASGYALPFALAALSCGALALLLTGTQALENLIALLLLAALASTLAILDRRVPYSWAGMLLWGATAFRGLELLHSTWEQLSLELLGLATLAFGITQYLSTLPGRRAGWRVIPGKARLTAMALPWFVASHAFGLGSLLFVLYGAAILFFWPLSTPDLSGLLLMTAGGLTGLTALTGYLQRRPLYAYPAALIGLACYWLLVLLPVSPLRSLPTDLLILPGIIIYLAAGLWLDHGTYAITGTHYRLNLRKPSFPFYGLALLGPVVLLAPGYLSDPGGDLLGKLPLLGASLLLYVLAALGLRQPLWLYPALLASYLGYGTVVSLLFPGLLAAHFTAVIGPFTLFLGCIALLVGWWERRPDAAMTTWSLPFTIATGAGALLTIGAAVPDSAVAFWATFAYAVFFGLLASARRSELLAVVTLGLLNLTALFLMLWLERDGAAPFYPALCALIASGAGYFLEARGRNQVGNATSKVQPSSQAPSLAQLWAKPLVWLAPALFCVAGGGVLIGFATAGFDEVRQHSFVGLVILLGMYINIVAYARRERSGWLAYLGVVVIECGYVLQLALWQVTFTPYYTIPAALTLLITGYLRRRRNEPRLATVIDSLGLALLLGSSLLLSIGATGQQRLGYGLLALIEGLIVAGSGVLQRYRLPFFAGILAVVLAASIQCAAPLSQVGRWYLIGGIGIILVGLAIILERTRQRVLILSRDLLTILERWA